MTARRGPDRLPNAPLRELFVASSLTASEVAWRCGWGREGRGADTTKLRRLLGLTDTKTIANGRIYRSFDVTVSIGNAKLLCQALEVDFDELYAEHDFEEEVAGECKLCGSPMLEPDPEDTCGLCWWEIEQFGRPDGQWMVAA